MKRTELERIERQVKRDQKREEIAQKRKVSGNGSVKDYINQLFNLFRYDDNEIFNTQEDISILETLEQIQSDLPEKKWDDVLRKAIKKAGVKQRDKAFSELKDLMGNSPN